jgi:hypothetical protein
VWLKIATRWIKLEYAVQSSLLEEIKQYTLTKFLFSDSRIVYFWTISIGSTSTAVIVRVIADLFKTATIAFSAILDFELSPVRAQVIFIGNPILKKSITLR